MCNKKLPCGHQCFKLCKEDCLTLSKQDENMLYETPCKEPTLKKLPCGHTEGIECGLNP